MRIPFFALIALLLHFAVLPRPAEATCDLLPQRSQVLRGASAKVDRPFAFGLGGSLTITPDNDCAASFPDPEHVSLYVETSTGPEIFIFTSDVQEANQWLFDTDICNDGTGARLGGLITEDSGALSLLFLVNQRGPARFFVDSVPRCDLSGVTCSDGPVGVQGCVDELFEADGTCGLAPENRAKTFSRFTILPEPNDFGEVCTSSEPGTNCQGQASALATVTDRDGNLIIPFDWSGVQLDPDFPTPRLVRITSDVEAFPGGGTPIQFPGPDFYDSFAVTGQLLPPFFDEVDDGTNVPKFLGTVDAPLGVIRLARRSPAFRECRDAGDAVLSPGVPCTRDSDCPAASTCGDAVCYASGVATAARCNQDSDCGGGEECGPALFDFSTRITIPAANYTAEALNPVPLDALIANEQAILNVRSEPLEANLLGADLNGDADTTDVAVVSIRNPANGDLINIGPVPGGGGPRAVGMATERVLEVAGSFPTATLDGDTAAFIDSANGDRLGVVRIDESAPDGFVDLTPAASPRVDGVPALDGEPIRLSSGLAFFRQAETAPTIRTQVDHVVGDPSTYGNAPVDGYNNVAVFGDISMSDDGRYVAYVSPAGDIGAFGGDRDLMILDRDTDEDGIFDEPGAMANVAIPDISFLASSEERNPQISGDGRYIVFESESTSFSHIMRMDRDADENGIFDDYFCVFFCSPVSFVQVTLGADGPSFNPSISRDGSRVAFESDASPTSLGFLQGSSNREVYAVDLDTSVTHWVRGVPPPDGDSRNAEISADGRTVAYETDATNHQFGAADSNGATDVLAWDWDSTFTAYLSAIQDPTDGGLTLGNASSTRPSVSGDGRFVTFASKATNLGGGEFLNQSAFLVDRDPDGNGSFGTSPDRMRSIPFPGTWDVWPRISADGDWISMSGSVDTFGPDPNLNNIAYQLVERSTLAVRFGLTTKDDSGFPPQMAPLHALSADGRDWVVLENPCIAFNQFPLPPGCAQRLDEYHVLASSTDRADTANDHNGDGDPLDSVLTVFDLATSTLTEIAPSGLAAVAEGHVLFLLPEAAENSAGGSPGSFPMGCQGTVLPQGCDLNGDGDAVDLVAHLLRPSPLSVENLGVAALDVDLDGSHMVLVESNGGSSPRVWVRSRDGGGSWIDLGLGFRGEVSNGRVVVYTSEDDAGNLNGDGDTNDDVVAIYDASTGTSVPFVDALGGGVGLQDARDFVLGDSLLAFRSSESAQSSTDLNLDGDSSDAVLRVVDIQSGRFLETRQAAIRCPVEACDPDLPYRVVGDTVIFLTPEAAQSGPNAQLAPGCLATGQVGQCDLDGDGAARSVIIQYYNAAQAIAADDDLAGVQTASLSAGGTCSDNGEACLVDDDCGSGRCIVAPGICAGPTGATCNPEVRSCQTFDTFCEPTGPTTGDCFQYSTPCGLDSDCGAGESCFSAGTEVRRPSNPLAEMGSDGRLGYLSRGVCIIEQGTSCVSSGDCSDGEVCNAATGTCQIRDTTCRSAEDCPDGFTCEPTLVFGGSADTDRDGIADLFDVCRDRPDPDQADLDGDGIGDACDRQTCGNGVQEYGEECDGGAGCDSACVYSGVGACQDGVDNDGDGKVDLLDGGCTSAADTSERELGRPCDDGIDNDGDYASDAPLDLGCFGPNSQSESPQCSDGIDNDGDGKVDFDGGAFGADPDPQCTNPSKNKEKSGCGLGFEAALALLLIQRLRRRRLAAR